MYLQFNCLVCWPRKKILLRIKNAHILYRYFQINDMRVCLNHGSSNVPNGSCMGWVKIDLLDQAAWVSDNVHTCTLLFLWRSLTIHSIALETKQRSTCMFTNRYMLRHPIVASVSKGFKIINGYWYRNYIKGNFNFMYFMNSSRIECRTMLYKFRGSLQRWGYIPEP